MSPFRVPLLLSVVLIGLGLVHPTQAQAVPNSIVVEFSGPDGVILRGTWENVDEYRHEVTRRVGDGPVTVIGVTQETETVFRDTGVQPGVTYHYQVRATHLVEGSTSFPGNIAHVLADKPRGVIKGDSFVGGLSWSGKVELGGEIVVRDGGTLDLNGTVLSEGGITAEEGGTVDANGVSLSRTGIGSRNGGMVDINGASLSGSGIGASHGGIVRLQGIVENTGGPGSVPSTVACNDFRGTLRDNGNSMRTTLGFASTVSNITLNASNFDMAASRVEIHAPAGRATTLTIQGVQTGSILVRPEQLAQNGGVQERHQCTATITGCTTKAIGVRFPADDLPLKIDNNRPPVDDFLVIDVEEARNSSQGQGILLLQNTGRSISNNTGVGQISLAGDAFRVNDNTIDQLGRNAIADATVHHRSALTGIRLAGELNGVQGNRIKAAVEMTGATFTGIHLSGAQPEVIFQFNFIEANVVSTGLNPSTNGGRGLALGNCKGNWIFSNIFACNASNLYLDIRSDRVCRENIVLNNAFREPLRGNGSSITNIGFPENCDGAENFGNNTYSDTGELFTNPGVGDGLFQRRIVRNIITGGLRDPANMEGNFWDHVDDATETVTQKCFTDDDAYTVVIDGKPIFGETIIINSSGDESDADPCDGVADVNLEQPGLQTTLRSALEQANYRRIQSWRSQPSPIEILGAAQSGFAFQTIYPSTALPPLRRPSTTLNLYHSLLIDCSFLPDGSDAALSIEAEKCHVRRIYLLSTGRDALRIRILDQSINRTRECTLDKVRVRGAGGSGIVAEDATVSVGSLELEDCSEHGMRMTGGVLKSLPDTIMTAKSCALNGLLLERSVPVSVSRVTGHFSEMGEAGLSMNTCANYDFGESNFHSSRYGVKVVDSSNILLRDLHASETVRVLSSTGVFISFKTNTRSLDNNPLMIDLGEAGVRQSTNRDPEAVNGGIPFPEILGATKYEGNGSKNSDSLEMRFDFPPAFVGDMRPTHLDIYATYEPHSSGHGGWVRRLGRVAIPPGSSTVRLSNIALEGVAYLTATASDQWGTSEFARNVPVLIASPPAKNWDEYNPGGDPGSDNNGNGVDDVWDYLWNGTQAGFPAGRGGSGGRPTSLGERTWAETGAGGGRTFVYQIPVNPWGEDICYAVQNWNEEDGNWATCAEFSVAHGWMDLLEETAVTCELLYDPGLRAVLARFDISEGGLFRTRAKIGDASRADGAEDLPRAGEG